MCDDTNHFRAECYLLSQQVDHQIGWFRGSTDAHFRSYCSQTPLGDIATVCNLCATESSLFGPLPFLSASSTGLPRWTASASWEIQPHLSCHANAPVYLRRTNAQLGVCLKGRCVRK